jgi:ankyrin repeat protein/ketosteroid isomerase-like protein
MPTLEETLPRGANTATTSRIIKAFYDTLVRGDVEGALDYLAEDVEWVFPRTRENQIIPWSGTRTGRSQIKEAFQQREELLQLEAYEPYEFIVQDRRAVVFVYERSICKPTGKAFELDIVHDLTVREDGKIVRWQVVFDHTSMVAALSADFDSRLITAIQNEDVPQVQRLLEMGADANTRDAETGLTVLMMAACQANLELVRILLDAGADVLTADSKTGATPLHKACQGGNADVVRLLIETGAFVDAVTPTMGHTPVMDALWYKWPEVVKVLVDHNANLNLSTHYGFSMMEHFRFELNVNTLGRDKLQAIDRIFKERQKVNEQAIQAQQIMVGTQKGDLEKVRTLIRERADVNSVYPIVNSFLDGHTPLLVAARDGHTEIVRELLQAGAKVRVEDWVFKGAPIHKATYNGNPEILKMLLAHPDIDINVQGPINGYTPLHDALWHGYTECAALLLEAGARLDLRGHDGKRPLDVARQVYGPNAELVKRIEASM